MKNTRTLAFDVYGTLVDTDGVISVLQQLVGDRARHFSHTWREKQLEYSFRRGLMQSYENFAVCIKDALDYACEFYGVKLTEQQKTALRASYRSLPVFSDVKDSLEELKALDYRLFAFSNGSVDVVDNLLGAAGIRDYFIEIVSVDAIKTFKPDPAVYAHFLKQADAEANNSWLISSNSFDVIGAVAAGMNAAWVRRSSNTVFDPWGIAPTITVETIAELHAKIN